MNLEVDILLGQDSDLFGNGRIHGCAAPLCLLQRRIKNSQSLLIDRLH